MAYTTTELLASIKRRANIPTATGVFSDAELLSIATEELRSYIVPLVLKEREDYWMTHSDVALTTATLYPIPVRAVGGKLREVSVIDGRGLETNLPRVSPADLERASVGFYPENGGLRIFIRGGQSPSTLGVSLRMRYYLRPSALVATTAAATFSQVTPSYTLTGGYATLTTPGTYDLIAAGSPFHVKQTDVAGSIAGATLTAASLSGAAVGDWLSMADTSPVPQCPVEFHDVLAQKVAIKVAESKNQMDRLGSLREELGRLEADARALISPRVDGEPVRAVNRGGLFRLRW